MEDGYLGTESPEDSNMWRYVDCSKDGQRLFLDDHNAVRYSRCGRNLTTVHADSAVTHDRGLSHASP